MWVVANSALEDSPPHQGLNEQIRSVPEPPKILPSHREGRIRPKSSRIRPRAEDSMRFEETFPGGAAWWGSMLRYVGLRW
eukprot:scaffold7466_cov248-Pinguiococcus_pyrenoidosus.AAC.5